LLQLSDSLLSELDSAIQQLPGSTHAQQVLVARVLEHLERVATDAQTDRQTGVILANAYVRLGNLQGDPYEQNIGDTPGAIRSLNKAVATLEPLAATYPKDASVLLALARAEEARGEILSQADDNDLAAASMRSGIASYESLLALPRPSAALCFETAVAYETYGDLLGQDMGFGDAAGALSNYRRAIDLDYRALSIDPNFTRVRRGLPVMQVKLGNVHLEDSPTTALDDFSKAMELLNSLLPADRSVLSSVRLQALIPRKQANALSELGRYTEARPLFSKSEAIYASLIAADSKDLRAKHDLLLLLTIQLECEEHAIDPVLAEPGKNQRDALERAQNVAQRKVQIVRELLKTKDQDADLMLELDSAEVHLFALQARARGHWAAGGKTLGDLTVLRDSVRDAKSSPHNLELVFSAFKMLDGSSLRDPALLLQCAQRGVNLTHQKEVEWVLALAEAYRASGEVQQSRKTASVGLALLNSAGGDGKEFRVRKLLEKAEAGR
jgi:tetratricopeptide (TPR) repeat protein